MMKLKKYIFGVALGALSLTLASCYNADKDFPDYEEGTTAYFAYQYPIRTLVLGNDIYDNTLDNEHKCRICATMGGAYGGRNAVADIIVEDTLCNDLWFVDAGGNASYRVTPLPSTHYQLLSNQIPYNGDARGYVEVQFTDAFFNDSNAIKDYYVIPLRMTHVEGIDRILTGTPREGLSPVRQNTADWEIPAKDYVLYCVKYMNPWQGNYIRRGYDEVKDANGNVTFTNVRKDFKLVNTDIEHLKENPVNANDEVCGITTKNMKQAIFPISIKTSANAATTPCNLLLTFNGNTCIVSTEDANMTVEGSGEFITKGTELPEYKDYQWGSNNGELVQRDILRLSYTVKFNNLQVSTNDTLVVRDRDSNKKVFFSPKYVKE